MSVRTAQQLMSSNSYYLSLPGLCGSPGINGRMAKLANATGQGPVGIIHWEFDSPYAHRRREAHGCVTINV